MPLPGLTEPPIRPALAGPARTVAAAGDIDTLVAELRIAARAAADSSRAKSTERAYGNDWRDFCAFARLIGRAPHPAEPETVALYVTDLARRGRAPATIARRLVSIAVYHRATGYPSPTEHGVVRAVVSGLRRQLGVAQQQKTALEIDSLRVVLARIPRDVRGLRDRALLLIGWAAAFTALRARRARRERPTVRAGRSYHRAAPIKDRSGSCRRGRPGSVWHAGANVPGARLARMARRGRKRWRSLSAHRSAWQNRLEPYGDGNRDDNPRPRVGRWDPRRFRWPFTARRFRDDRSACRPKRGVDHAAWSLEKHSGRASLYSTWFALA
jgi:hypothetical protein